MGGLGSYYYEQKLTAEEARAKRQAAGGIGEGLAQTLYPKARFVFEQYAAGGGGADFTLPGGGWLEVKFAAIGKYVKCSPKQREQLGHRSSRLVVGVYNRQTAEIHGDEDPASWVKPLANAMMFILDVPGPWFVRLTLPKSQGGIGTGNQDGEVNLLTNEIVQAVSREKVCGKFIEQINWGVHVPHPYLERPKIKVERAQLIIYTMGKSPHQQLLSPRKARAARQAVPF